VLSRGKSSYANIVQRLFSMFPQGGPGVALLLLRISVAAIFMVNLTHCFRVSSTPLLSACFLLTSAITISLSIGFLTPFLAVIACASALADLLVAPNLGSVLYVIALFDSAALALLGPGAYSLDARLFGLRVTVVPPRRNTDRL
jgi:hypothetical protein